MKQRVDLISFEEFVEWERSQSDKHEFLAGHVVAFSGVTIDHSAISRNILVAVDAAVQPPCQAYGSDAIIETATRKQQYGLRADVVVTCSPDDSGAAKYLRMPRIVIEVISPSNTGEAWRSKLLEYWNTSCIRQLVLVESEIRRAEYFVRGDDAAWHPPVFVSNDGAISFELGFEVPLASFYRRTSLDDAP